MKNLLKYMNIFSNTNINHTFAPNPLIINKINKKQKNSCKKISFIVTNAQLVLAFVFILH